MLLPLILLYPNRTRGCTSAPISFHPYLYARHRQTPHVTSDASAASSTPLPPPPSLATGEER